jgi:hypothetical protein
VNYLAARSPANRVERTPQYAEVTR